jgi:hypothetical protein
VALAFEAALGALEVVELAVDDDLQCLILACDRLVSGRRSMVLNRAWPSPTGRSSASHVRCPSGPRWVSRRVARTKAPARIGSRAEYIATIPHMLCLLS